MLSCFLQRSILEGACNAVPNVVTQLLETRKTRLEEYRHIRNYYLSNSKTFQDGNGNGNFRKIISNDFQDGNWESMEMKG